MSTFTFEIERLCMVIINFCFYTQSPDDNRLRRRAGVSLSLSDTEAETEIDYHRGGRSTPHQKFFKYGDSHHEM